MNEGRRWGAGVAYATQGHLLVPDSTASPSQQHGLIPKAVATLTSKTQATTVILQWFGAFPGAFGLGRAQPQRRGTSP